MLTGKQRTEQLVVLAVIGALALNYPLLSLFAGGDLVFGIPLLYLYHFAIWGGLIALAGFILEGKTIQETAETAATPPSEGGKGNA
jgi:hypothetical protein